MTTTETQRISITTAEKHLRNLAAILSRKHTTGRNAAARERGIESHLTRLGEFFRTAEETPQTERMYARYVTLERRWLGL